MDDDFFSGGKKANAWFKGGGSAKGFIERKKKEWEEEEALRQEQQAIEAAKAEEVKKEQESKKGFFDKVGDAGKAVGGFVKDAAVDVKDTAVGAWQGLGDVARGEMASRDLARNTEKVNANNKEWSAYMRTLSDADWEKPEVKAKLKEFSDKSKAIQGEVSQNTKDDLAASQKVDAKKTAFQSAETFLNVATLGVGTPLKAGGKALAKQGVKQITKQTVKEAIKVGGTEAAEQLIKEAGEAGAKKLAQEALETGTKEVVKKGAKYLAKEGAKDAAIGAAYGVTQTGKRADDDTDVNDYLLNMAFGAGIGFAIPTVGAGLKKGGQKVASAVSPKSRAASKVASETADAVTPDGKIDVNAQINKAIEEQSDKYGQTALTRLKNWVGDQIDPNRAFVKIDDAYAKQNGIKRTLLNSEDSLEDLARRSNVSEREAAGLFEKKLTTKLDDGSTHQMSAKELVQKYKGDSPEGMEFNNYANAKFDLEFRAKNNGKKRIQNSLETADLERFVKEYEAKNADALKDLGIKKAVNDEAVDYMVKSKVLTKAEGDQIKKSYKYAVPLERVFPDDLARPEMVGKNIGSIAKQTVIQRLEGGSDIPLSNSFDTMLNRVYKAVSQGNRAKLAQKMLERAEAGLLDGANVVVTAGNKEARAAIRENVALVNKAVRVAESKVKISNRQMRKLESELNKLNKEGMKVSLKEGGKTPMPDFAVDGLSKLSTTKGKTTTSRQFFKSLIEADPKDIERIRSKIITREPKLAAKLDEISNYKAKIDAYKAVRTDMKEVTADFMDDPTTGKQIISGVIDGQTYKMEVPPDLAKAVMGMENAKLPTVLKALAIAKKPFEVTWTGLFNPVFSAMSFVFYDTPMSIINSPQGFKTMGPKAVKEMFKSFKTSSEFQQKLAAEGARPYGGSGASAFLRPDAKALAAQRDILSSLKFTAKNPEVALSKLDVWGGKLANATRTRIARAEYDNALKRGLTEKQAMEQATLAYRTIMPDFDTMSNLTRQINSVVPFYAASTAGLRSFGKALRRDPAGTTAKAITLGIAPTVGVTAFSLMQPAGQEFYKDMEKSGNKRTLDDNLIIVMPGAHKDDKTGEWSGIIKIPLAPEFRSINQSVWRGVRGAMGKGDGPEASHVALSMFDAVTGGIRTSENPLISTQRILSGEDPRTGERIIKGSMADLPQDEQMYDSTSGAGKFIGKVLGTSPIQGDKILGQFGLVGQTAKNGGDPIGAVEKNLDNRFTGAFGQRASDSFYDAYSPLKTKRDKASREITELVKLGRINEAKRKANEFNATLDGKFADFNKDFGGSDAYNPDWDEMIGGLYIKTTENAFKAREKQ